MVECKMWRTTVPEEGKNMRITCEVTGNARLRVKEIALDVALPLPRPRSASYTVPVPNEVWEDSHPVSPLDQGIAWPVRVAFHPWPVAPARPKFAACQDEYG